MRIILAHNYFDFNGRMYKQLRGTAMGTKMAPAFANLFMARLEEAALEGSAVKPATWNRFIDDIFVTWKGSHDEFENFMQYLNNLHPYIKFTHAVSSKEAVFMDLELFKGPRFGEEGILDIRPHFKNTNRFQYLQHSSAHPRHTEEW